MNRINFIRKKNELLGVPIVLQWVKNLTAAAQVAVKAWVCSLTPVQWVKKDSIPGLGTFICFRCSYKTKQNKTKERKEKKKSTSYI